MSVKPGERLDKDSDAIVVYEFDWSDYLGSATIVTSTWTISGPDSVLTKDQESVVTGSQKTRVRLSAGTRGKSYTLANKIVTNETPAQTDERSITIRVRDL